MKLEEAMKKATPGPLELHHSWQRWELNTTTLACAVTVAGIDDEDNQCHVDAALLAHWYNHGPKLLEALRRMFDHNHGYRNEDELNAIHMLASEAEEVEGI